jgi:glycosyltransferase involved in cell wall biosynthesis
LSASSVKSAVLSFVVPAHDEEALIGLTLRAIRSAAEAVGQSYEVIVVDDASTDRTSAIASAEAARCGRIPSSNCWGRLCGLVWAVRARCRIEANSGSGTVRDGGIVVEHEGHED